MAEKKAEAKKAAQHPETPSGKGLQAAEGESDPVKAAELYHAAKKEARWG